jgi:hypothetical protein
MKFQMKFSTLFNSVASLLVLGGFIWLAAGSVETKPYEDNPYQADVRVLPDGRFEETNTHKWARESPDRYSTIDVTTGNKDKQGFWDGYVEKQLYGKLESRPDRTLLQVESGPYVDGKMHGNFTLKKSSMGGGFKISYPIYEMGKYKGEWKTKDINTSPGSAFEVILSKYSSYLELLTISAFTSEEVQTYADSLEAILGRMDFTAAEFSDNYSSAKSGLNNYPLFDTISDAITEILIPEWRYRIKGNELRLAVLQRNRNGSGTTYASVESMHPGYLAYMNANQVTNPDFDAFCQEFDSIMDSHGPLNPADTFFVDSVDVRMYWTMNEMYRKTPSAGLAIALKSGLKSLNVEEIRMIAERVFKQLKSSENSMGKVIDAYLLDLLLEYDEADFMKAAVKEACFSKRNWGQLPVLTTVYSGSNSTTSVTVRGNVLESIGADVTSRGIAWAETYNPAVDNQVVYSGSGVGIFQVAIDGLEPGKTYYARSFATNLAGTAYGNIIKFTTGRVSSAGIPDLPALSVNVYPNPAYRSATVNYSAELPGNYLITLHNMNGQPVFSREIRHSAPGQYSMSVDLSLVPVGIYFCRVSNGARSSVCKLIKAE